MRRNEVPTAGDVVCTELEAARKALDDFRLPVVVKASGLAAGRLAGHNALRPPISTVLGFLDGGEGTA